MFRIARDLIQEDSPSLRWALDAWPREEISARVEVAVQNGAALLWTAWSEARLLAASLYQPMPGRVAQFSPPQLAEGGGEAGVELVKKMLDDAEQAGAHLVQSLLPTLLAPSAQTLVAGGMQWLCDLQFFSIGPTAREARVAPPGFSLRKCQFTSAEIQMIERLIARTYEGSLDCPELNGVREFGDIVSGHLASGIDREWWVLSQGDDDIACLLLTEHPGALWELEYLGVAPEGRRRGLGAFMTSLALERAKEHHATLMVAADRRNVAACSLYSRFTMQAGETRRVYFWGRRPQASPRRE